MPCEFVTEEKKQRKLLEEKRGERRLRKIARTGYRNTAASPEDAQKALDMALKNFIPRKRKTFLDDPAVIKTYRESKKCEAAIIPKPGTAQPQEGPPAKRQRQRKEEAATSPKKKRQRPNSKVKPVTEKLVGKEKATTSPKKKTTKRNAKQVTDEDANEWNKLFHQGAAGNEQLPTPNSSSDDDFTVASDFEAELQAEFDTAPGSPEDDLKAESQTESIATPNSFLDCDFEVDPDYEAELEAEFVAASGSLDELEAKPEAEIKAKTGSSDDNSDPKFDAGIEALFEAEYNSPDELEINATTDSSNDNLDPKFTEDTGPFPEYDAAIDALFEAAPDSPIDSLILLEAYPEHGAEIVELLDAAPNSPVDGLLDTEQQVTQPRRSIMNMMCCRKSNDVHFRIV